jgi:hypothetical protein
MRQPRYSGHKDPIVSEFVRDCQQLFAEIPVVEYLEFELLTEDFPVNLRPQKVQVPKCVTLAWLQRKDDETEDTEAAVVRWDWEGEHIVVRGIGGLTASKTYLFRLRVEGE